MEDFFTFLFLVFLYVLIGLVVSVPFCLLAGWSWEYWSGAATLAPLFLLVWVVFGVFAGYIYQRPGHKWPIGFSLAGHNSLPGCKNVFWVWTIICLSPIVAHWSSVTLRAWGYGLIAAMVYEHRYAAPAYTFLGVLGLSVLVGMAIKVWTMARSRWAKFTGPRAPLDYPS